jgi:hypothetical protein
VFAAHVDDGRVIVDVHQVEPSATTPTDDSGPASIAGSYSLTGTMNGAALSATAVVTWSDALTVFLDRGTPLLTVSTGSVYSGSYSDISVDGASVDALAPAGSLQWLSLPPGATDSGAAGGPATTQPSPATWTIAGAGASFTIHLEGVAAPWPSFTIDLTAPGQALHLELAER